MSILEWWNLVDWLIDPAQHFLLAFTAGALVFWLTSIISYVSILAWERGTHQRVSSDVVFGIVICSLLLGVSAVLVSHYGLDFGWQLYSMPLNPPLELVIP